MIIPSSETSFVNVRIDADSEVLESDVAKFYAGRKVLVTGGTGYIGKCLVFKLLNDCQDIRKILLLLRGKGNYTFEQRRKRYLTYDIFKHLRDPKLLDKLEFVEGSLDQDGLGLGGEIRSVILEQVSVVFHSAASVDLSDGYKAVE